MSDVTLTDGGSETAANRRAIALMEKIRAANPDLRIDIDAPIGPRGDGYRADGTDRRHLAAIAAAWRK
jgi:hypothetical protein